MLIHEVASRSGGIRISRAISIDGAPDRVAARQQGMMFAVGLGFSSSEATNVATAISELAASMLVDATRGEIVLSAMSHSVPPALTVTARSQGKGMADVSHAPEDRHSTWGRLGNGPAGAERLIDSFEIVSEVRPGLVATEGEPHDGRSTAGTKESPQPLAELQPRSAAVVSRD